MVNFIIGYVLGVFSLSIFCLFRNSSKISRIEEVEDIKKKTFDEKYNLGKEFSEKD
jgi:hypothetical protein